MNLLRRKQPITQVPRKPKKGKCKIKIKRTPNGEEFEFSPECTREQIEFAKNNRQERSE